MRKIIALILCAGFLAGCVTLRSSERYDYRELENRLYAVGLESEQTNSPGLAGALNLLPGIGNAYLSQWGLFVVNLITWPISILWGIPQAVTDAKALNAKDTLYFYQFGAGKDKLESLEAASNK